MTFDEQLRQSFKSLSDRLREEVERHFESSATELSTLAREHADAAAAAAVASLASTAEPADDPSERLLEATRSIDNAQSLTEILNTLVRCLAQEAPRAGVLMVRDLTLHGWRFSGFNPVVDPHSIDVPFERAGAIAEAARTMTAISGQPPPAFAQLPAGCECLAVPIVVAGRVVAVAYADQGSDPQLQIANARIEVIVRHAARALEALIALKAARSLVDRSDPSNSSPVASTQATSDDSDAAAGQYAKLLN